MQKTMGELIKEMRISMGYTQKQLADMLSVSDRAVSKWERGYGFPDLSLICQLSDILGTTVECLLSCKTGEGNNRSVDMKTTKLYICKECNNIFTSTGQLSAACCGKKLSPLKLMLADEKHSLRLEHFDSDIIVLSEHEMTKEHHIELVAVISESTLILYKQYPEWSINARIPATVHGLLVTVCNRDGAFVQKI